MVTLGMHIGPLWNGLSAGWLRLLAQKVKVKGKGVASKLQPETI